MNNKIRTISHNIRKGNNLEENIPQLFNHLADHYQTYAGVRLAMHYFTFYETYYDDENTWSEEAKNITKEINLLVHDYVLKSQSGAAREAAIHKADILRNNIMNRMNALIAYTDIFQTYEYVFNRLEFRFKKNIEAVDEVEFSKEILRFIFDTEDNLVINEKIKDIISQLPIRITKQKYFEILKESIQTYLGADKTSLDSFLYMLRTSAMLYHEDSMESLYPPLWEKKEYLSRLEYKDITEKDYNNALSILQAVTLTLETETSVYFGLQEIMNEIYTMLLSSPYAGMVPSNSENADKAFFAIIREINDIFIIEEKKEIPEELVEEFQALEGIQEDITIEIDFMEDALYDIDHNYRTLTEGLMLCELKNVLLRSQKLLSNSLFIDLEQGEKQEIMVDEEILRKEAESFEKELTELFAGQDRMVSRAVMASTLSKIPVFFKSHKEVMDYVLYSFERCTDYYEKAASINMINNIMSE